MQLTKLSLWNCAPLGTSEVSFGRVTAVVGRSGSGKTALLTAIERAREWIAPYGASRPALAPLIATEGQGAKIVMAFAFDAQEQQRFGLARDADAEVLVATLGDPRVDASEELVAALAWTGDDGSQGTFDSLSVDRSLRLAGYGTFEARQYLALSASGEEAKLAWVEGFCCDAAMGTEPAAASRQSALNAAFETHSFDLRLVGVRRVERSSTYLPSFRTAGGERLGLRSLSSGERQLVLFAVTRLALSPRRSILLVDNLERDLDPRSQVSLLRLLMEGENQVVFTTHSEALRRAAEVTTTIQLDERAKR